MFEFDENTVVDTIIFVNPKDPREDWDFLGSVYKMPDGNWYMKYRFRYDGKDGQGDEWNWYLVKAKPGVKPAVFRNLLMKMIESSLNFSMADDTDVNVDIIECDNCSGIEAWRKMASRPWCRVREIKGPDDVGINMPGGEA